MKRDIPEEAYWKLRCVVLEKAVHTERSMHIGRLKLLLQNTQGFINELAGLVNEYNGVLSDAKGMADIQFKELTAEIGGGIGMEGNPEEWNVKLVDEFSSFMEQKD